MLYRRWLTRTIILIHTTDHHHQTELPLSSLDLSYDGSQSPGSGIGTGGGGGGGGGGMGSDGSGCGGGGGGIGHGMSAHSRSKRMRTSFKHHQLRTMKSYFAINQNPDAKDLKQLAQKTGLSKRVLQVSDQTTFAIIGPCTNASSAQNRSGSRTPGPSGGAT